MPSGFLCGRSPQPCPVGVRRVPAAVGAGVRWGIWAGLPDDLPAGRVARSPCGRCFGWSPPDVPKQPREGFALAVVSLPWPMVAVRAGGVLRVSRAPCRGARCRMYRRGFGEKTPRERRAVPRPVDLTRLALSGVPIGGCPLPRFSQPDVLQPSPGSRSRRRRGRRPLPDHVAVKVCGRSGVFDGLRPPCPFGHCRRAAKGAKVSQMLLQR